MPSYFAFNKRGDRTDGSDSLPYTGLSGLGLGFFGVAVMAPFALAMDPVAFFGNVSAGHLIAGLGSAGLIDYTLSRLTDNGKRWPRLPIWVSSSSIRMFVVSLLLQGAVFGGIHAVYLFVPSWLPVLAIGMMHAFAVGSVVTTIVGSARSGIWAVRQLTSSRA